MLQSRKAKCIGSALALGGIAAAFSLSGCGSTSTLPEETTSAANQQETLDDENAQGDGEAYNGEAGDDGQLAAGDDGDSYDGDTADIDDDDDDDDDDEEYDDQYYLDMANKIAEQTGTFLDAVRAGDLDTIMAMAYPDGDYYDYFEELQDYDCTEEFLRTIYGNLEYTFNDEILEDLADRLSSAYRLENETVFVDVAYSVPYMLLFKYAYLQSLPAGSEIPEYNYVKYNDDALELLQEIVSNTPFDKAGSFWVTLPDEDGNVQVILDDVFDDLKLNRIDRYLDEDFPTAFVNKFCLDITASQVGNVTVPFKDYDEELTAALPYLEAKDFQGLLDWLDENTDENFREHFESTYGSYDDLTDTQKAYVDDFVDTQISMVFIDEQIDAVDAPYRSGLFLQTYPMLDDYDNRDMPLTDWYRENNVSSIHLFYPSTESPDQLDTFLYGWFEAIAYAKEYVE